MFAIGEASRQSGVSIETIRYYEREGIVGKAGRSGSGRRLYTEAEIAELRFIKNCRDLGFAIKDAVALRNLRQDPDGACAAVEEMGRAHLADVRAKIRDLKQLEAALVELVGNCGQGQVICPMLDGLMGYQA